MFASRFCARIAGPALAFVVCAAAARASAQEAAGPQGEHQHPPDTAAEHQHPPEAPVDEHQHAAAAQHDHQAGAAIDLFPPYEGSGTSWLPQTTPMYAIHQQAGAWQTMWHGNAFLQYLRETGDRGSDQVGSVNWLMGMARRPLWGGRFGVRGMLSLESWTIRGCGYPDLLASGELCGGEAIHDRQHPHDLLMELAAEYERPFARTLRWNVYAGVAGEPALGPVAYPHRVSAMANPLAPIAHHWLDATHITFGVVTGGIAGRLWKAEASAFNGREPDEQRRNIDFGRLDSFSGRVSVAPRESLVFQVSAGHLVEAEAAHAGEPRTDVDRITASIAYHRQLGAGGLWATTIAWGRNDEGVRSTSAVLLESSLTLHGRDAWFGRVEAVSKAAHDLDIHGTEDTFPVGKVQAGYTRYFPAAWRLEPGIGGSVSFGVVPETLVPLYGSRVTPGFAVFLTLRPASHAASAGAPDHAGHHP